MILLIFLELITAMSLLRMAILMRTYNTVAHPKPKYQPLLSKVFPQPFQAISNREYQQKIWKPGQSDLLLLIFRSHQS